MSDLVEMLRKGVEWRNGDYQIWATNETMRNAADRIEQLERVLLQAREALSVALSDVEWRPESQTQPMLVKAYNKADEALK